MIQYYQRKITDLDSHVQHLIMDIRGYTYVNLRALARAEDRLVELIHALSDAAEGIAREPVSQRPPAVDTLPDLDAL